MIPAACGTQPELSPMPDRVLGPNCAIQAARTESPAPDSATSAP